MRKALAVALVAVVACSTLALAQRGFFFTRRYDLPIENVPYDGQFTFVRIKFAHGDDGYYYRGLPAWAHGYPRAERNLEKILAEVTYVNPKMEESNVIALDDPALFHYPVAYMTEAGFWQLNDKEAASFRAYLKKGGFVIFDDFRSDFRGGGGWANFEANMRKVLPEGQFIDLDPQRDLIFHSFFEIDSLSVIPQAYDQARPQIRGIFEDNDPKKRLMVIANHQTDISEYWEFSATGFKPIEESNEAYKLGVNYFIYGLTH
jgi:hypothetical protein